MPSIFIFCKKMSKLLISVFQTDSKPATTMIGRPLFAETLYNPRNEKERMLGPGIRPYRSREQCSAHAASLLPEVPETGGVRVKLELEKFYDVDVRFVERVFPKDVTITDVQNLCVTSGLEPGTFELYIEGSCVTKRYDLKLDDGVSETENQEARIKVGYSSFYLERRIGH